MPVKIAKMPPYHFSFHTSYPYNSNMESKAYRSQSSSPQKVRKPFSHVRPHYYLPTYNPLIGSQYHQDQWYFPAYIQSYHPTAPPPMNPTAPSLPSASSDISAASHSSGDAEFPPWVSTFRPNWTSSPIPECHSIEHAMLIREALTKFHLAVYLADEDAGESQERMVEHLRLICDQYMPSMRKLGIRKYQIVFFYHGRFMIDTGNLVWEAITMWEEGQKLG